MIKKNIQSNGDLMEQVKNYKYNCKSGSVSGYLTGMRKEHLN